jgi:hypothetical protein
VKRASSRRLPLASRYDFDLSSIFRKKKISKIFAAEDRVKNCQYAHRDSIVVHKLHLHREEEEEDQVIKIILTFVKRAYGITREI